MVDRDRDISKLYDGLTFISRQSRELGSQLHPEMPLVAHSLLSFVAAEPEPRAVDIALAYGLDKSTVSRQLGQLEAAGLLSRGEETPGRRGHVLKLTPAGAQALERAAQSSRKTLAMHLVQWQDHDIATLATLLAQFVETSRRERRSDSIVFE